MSINNSPLDNLQANLSNWQELGKIKESEKINIQGFNGALGSGNVRISRAGALQNAGRSLSKLFQKTIADGEGTKVWVQGLQEKTCTDIFALRNSINSRDQKSLDELEYYKNSLVEIRDALQQSQVGLKNLSATYRKERTGNDELSNSLEESSNINDPLISELDEQIANLNERINQTIQETYTKFEEASNNKTVYSGKISDVEHPENLTRESLELVQELAQEAMKKTTTYTVGKKNYSIPSQFYKDVTRSHMQLNNETLIDNKKPGSNTIEGAYNGILKAVDNSESAAAVVMALSCQTLFAPSQIHLMLETGGAFNYRQDQVLYQIQVEEGKVHLKSQILYNLHPMENPDGPPAGHQFVQKEIVLSLDELKALQPSEPDIALKNIEVTDLYSPVIESQDAARMFLLKK